MKFHPLVASLFLTCAVAAAPLAQAYDHDGRDAQKYAAIAAQAKISLTDAIAKANAQTAGTPLEAELERERGVVVYKVKILNQNQIMKVLVDSQTGAIISSYIDR
ncbi:Peptidase propeptide domain-containing protein [Herbaspirillum sp. CF444]|uniref:PepSY domain-containing protein n=1 Tax=Herbaspirillum sp. CF444 TaxID=1144319 RepID=UPI0002724C4A|nr:PepSY domain-containing protein [Herbaspirillum sp. CF444]EJL83361.1 Peptidase propeptide domain-containing protein [Herbaspirillum sp. CF444]